jgi:Holliday junction resolvasome RuvABC DNA-binding subunit
MKMVTNKNSKAVNKTPETGTKTSTEILNACQDQVVDLEAELESRGFTELA